MKKNLKLMALLPFLLVTACHQSNAMSPEALADVGENALAEVLWRLFQRPQAARQQNYTPAVAYEAESPKKKILAPQLPPLRRNDWQKLQDERKLKGAGAHRNFLDLEDRCFPGGSKARIRLLQKGVDGETFAYTIKIYLEYVLDGTANHWEKWKHDVQAGYKVFGSSYIHVNPYSSLEELNAQVGELFHIPANKVRLRPIEEETRTLSPEIDKIEDLVPVVAKSQALILMCKHLEQEEFESSTLEDEGDESESEEAKDQS